MASHKDRTPPDLNFGDLLNWHLRMELARPPPEKAV